MSLGFELKDFGFLKDHGLDGVSKGTNITRTIIPAFEILYREESGFGIYEVEDEKERFFNIKGTFVAPLTIGQTYRVEGYVTEYRGEKQLTVQRINQVKPINKRGIIAYLQTVHGLKTRAKLIYDKFGDKSIETLMYHPERVATIKGIGLKSAKKWAAQLEAMKDTQEFMATLLGFGLTPKQAKDLFQEYGEEIIPMIEKNPYFLAKRVQGYGFERCDRIARTMGHDLKSNFRLDEGVMHTIELSHMEGHVFLPQEELIERASDLLSVKLTYQEMVQLVAEQAGSDTIVYGISDRHYELPYHEVQAALHAYEKSRSMKDKEKNRYVVIQITEDDILRSFERLAEEKRIKIENDRIYESSLHHAEQEVAKHVVRLSKEKPFKKDIGLEKTLDDYLNEKGYHLEEKQREAVLRFAKHEGGFFILNGSAGVGKTFTLNIILTLLEKNYAYNRKRPMIEVLAPTGKASKVAAKSTGRDCKTVHRGLGYKPGLGFTVNEDEPLEANIVVVDESSMLDTTLTHNLLRAIKTGTKVIFLGDTKQLPSIGAGNILKDLINSNIVEVVTLEVVKRQDALSGIIKNANRIIASEMIETEAETKDAYVVHRDSPVSAMRGILASVERVLQFPDYNLEDIQVLAPQRTGAIGTHMINYAMKEKFNPRPNGEKKVLNLSFKVTNGNNTEQYQLYYEKGDKVIHIKNNYDMTWYMKHPNGNFEVNHSLIGITNGECGVIEDIIDVVIEKEKKTRIIVRYEDGYVFYDGNFDELDHAFALTIHKSQGSQWKAVILPIMNNYYMMLDNNLLYTGYTRAEQFNCVVGQERAIHHAITTFKTSVRHTTLAERIQAIANQ